ncbi:Maltose excess protein 1, chloroplastic, partial [Mucuna pruriens]
MQSSSLTLYGAASNNPLKFKPMAKCYISTPFAPLRHNANFSQFKYLTPSFSCPLHNPLFLLNISASSHFVFPRRRPNLAVEAFDSDAPNQHSLKGSVNVGTNESHQQWDSLTAKFSAAANIPFLLLQMPQIILNARNLLSGNKIALSAVPWLGMLTSLLGNLSLLSYFAKKREKEAMVVQTLGVVSTHVVLVQLALAETMPFPYFLATSLVVVSGLVLNFFNYFGLLNAGIWRFWEDFITIGGLSVLPQIMWSTFVPYIPNSILPGAAAFVIAVVAVTMARTGKLSEKGVKFVGGISGWTATLLFMWMPVSQMWTNYLNPENMKGLSAFSMLLAMLGNGLMLPRALLIRDFILNIISKEFFLAATVGLLSWIGYSLDPIALINTLSRIPVGNIAAYIPQKCDSVGMAFWRDSVVHGYSSPLASLRDLVFGSLS